MTQFILHIGPAADYYFFQDKILTRHLSSEPQSFIYILPVSRAVRRFKKELIRYTTGGALIDPLVFTFDDLLQHIYHKQGARKKVISDDQRRILISEFLKENRQSLTYFTSERITEEGIVQRIEQMVGELARFGYSAKNLQKMVPHSGNKINDFIRLLQGLQEKMGPSLTDKFLYIDEVLTNLDYREFNTLFPGVKSLYLNGYGLFTPPMIRFLAIVKSWLDIEVKIEYLPQNKVLFAHSKPAFESISALADKIITHDVQNDPLAMHLFNRDKRIVKQTTSFFIYMYRDRESEVSGIAAEARRLHRENGLPWHRIGITFPDQESYRPLITTIFNSYGIPFNLSTGFALSHSSLIQTILLVMQTVSHAYRMEDVINLLGNPFLNHAQAVNRNGLKRLAIQNAIKQFNGSWYDQLKRQIEHSTLTEDSLRYINNLLTKLGKLEPWQTPVVFRDTFYQVMKEIGLLSWYQRANPYLDVTEKEQEFRAFNRFIKLFDQLIWFLDRMFPKKKMAVESYVFYLKPVVRNALYNIREWSNWGVQIMPRLEIQSVAYQVLFMGGMVEGSFPRAATANLFFNEQERRHLGLYSGDDILNQDRFQFYQLLASKAERIILTRPLSENEQTQISSSFLSALQTSVETEVSKYVETPDDMADVQLRRYFGRQLVNRPTKEVQARLQEWIKTQDPAQIDHWLAGIGIYRRKKQYDTLSTYEGNLTSGAGAGLYLKSRLKQRTFSVTALEQYAFCPMHYFLQRILEIQPEEDYEEDISAMRRGRLIHTILHTFYTRLQTEGDAGQPWQYPHLLRHITDEMLQQLDQTGLTILLEREALLGSEQEPGMWKTFLEHEAIEIPRTGFTPVLFEWTFGTEHAFAIQGKNGAVYLTGIIDRIDIDGQGNFLVFDYKTGQAAQQTRMKEIYDGYSLQLPVYLAAVDRLADKAIRPAGAAWYQVKDSENCRRVYVITDSENAAHLMSGGDGKLPNKKYDGITLPVLVERTLERVTALVEELLNGQFRHTRFPKDRRCSHYCPYYLICRKDGSKLMHLEENIKSCCN